MAQFSPSFNHAVTSGNVLTGMVLTLTDVSNYGTPDTPLSNREDFLVRQFEVRDSSNNVLFSKYLAGNETEAQFSLGGLLTLQPLSVTMSLNTVAYAGAWYTSKTAYLVGVLPSA